MIKIRTALSDMRVVFGLIIAFGLVLRLVGLSTQSLWLDEMTSIEVARKPLGSILKGQGFDNHTPPLYYMLLHVWGRFVPLTETGLRLPSALIELANMLLLASLCRRFLTVANSFLVVFAYALSPFMLYYAQEGRMYTLAVLLALAYTLTFERLLRAQKHLYFWAITSGVILAMGVYNHYYHAFFACALICAGLVVVRKSRKRVIAILASGIVGVLLFAPWIPTAARLAASSGQTFRTFVASVVPYTFFRFVVGYAVFPLNMHTKEQFSRAVVEHAPELAVVFASLLLLLWNLRPLTERRTLMGVLVAGWLVTGPMLISLLISLRTPMLSERYLSVTFPLFLVAVLGFQDLTRRRVLVGVGLFFTLMIWGNLAYFFNPQFGKAQWRDAGAYVAKAVGNDDVVLVEPSYTAGVFRYYFNGDRPVQPLPSPHSGKNLSGGATELRRILASHRGVILVSSGDTAEAGFARTLSQFARKTRTQVFPLETGITCTTWDLRESQATR